MHFPTRISSRLSSLRDIARNARDSSTFPQVNRERLPNRIADVFFRTWDLGFTAFGGPPVHFQILHQRFVEGRGGKEKWVDEQTVSHGVRFFELFMKGRLDVV